MSGNSEQLPLLFAEECHPVALTVWILTFQLLTVFGPRSDT